MSKQEIIENNKLIAEFMGYIYVGKKIVLHTRGNVIYFKPTYDGYVHKEHVNIANKYDFYLGQKILNDKLDDLTELSDDIRYLTDINGWYLSAIRNCSTKLNWLHSNLKYHLSWDWLMPVIEKIEKEFTVKIIRYADELSNICEIEITEDDPLQITYCCGYDYDGKTKIQVVFDAVVEFIKWYNQNK